MYNCCFICLEFSWFLCITAAYNNNKYNYAPRAPKVRLFVVETGKRQVTLIYMLDIEYIICSRCVSALHPSIAALGFALGYYLGVQV